mmetsp:Transcript_8220/g.19055  ORF Transcript_8220/g.19055 Transcript_8220/m.19055 type:complete len:230 (-) Transcript_8220:930-1619(-)
MLHQCHVGKLSLQFVSIDKQVFKLPDRSNRLRNLAMQKIVSQVQHFKAMQGANPRRDFAIAIRSSQRDFPELRQLLECFWNGCWIQKHIIRQKQILHIGNQPQLRRNAALKSIRRHIQVLQRLQIRQRRRNRARNVILLDSQKLQRGAMGHAGEFAPQQIVVHVHHANVLESKQTTRHFSFQCIAREIQCSEIHKFWQQVVVEHSSQFIVSQVHFLQPRHVCNGGQVAR